MNFQESRIHQTSSSRIRRFDAVTYPDVYLYSNSFSRCLPCSLEDEIYEVLSTSTYIFDQAVSPRNHLSNNEKSLLCKYEGFPVCCGLNNPQSSSAGIVAVLVLYSEFPPLRKNPSPPVHI